MDRQEMKGPSRPAPAVPHLNLNSYSLVTKWNNDPFGADVFEPMPQGVQKKKPPPRPPPPKLNPKSNPDVPARPSHFIRKPTVLSSLLIRKNKYTDAQHVSSNHTVFQESFPDNNTGVDASNFFPKCEPKIVNTGALIDLSSPPSSPTFTTRSSSDGLSVDSFGSDATTSTNHHTVNGGNASQAESGFEDDFEMILHSRRTLSREDTFDDCSNVDPFSPQPVQNNLIAIQKPPIMKKPVLNQDYLKSNSKSVQNAAVSLRPTIIRAKPARPKPPDSTSLLKSTFGNNLILPSMNVNTTTPIQKMSNGFTDIPDSKPFNWDEESSPEREPSPPMPLIPPPPPPQLDNVTVEWQDNTCTSLTRREQSHPYRLNSMEDEPYAVALYDYHTDHPDDLSFTANTKIYLIRRENAEWLYGRLRSGTQGLFPINYVEIKVPFPNEKMEPPRIYKKVTVLYDFEPVQPGDLRLNYGDTVSVIDKLNDEWYFGECNGMRGQFPANYVQFI